MKDFKLEKTKRITNLILGLCLMTGMIPAVANAKCTHEGGCSSGGGLTIDGVDLDTYLGDRKMPTDQVEAMMSDTIRKLGESDPILQAAFLNDVRSLHYYFVDKPLDQLPFTKTLPFATDQTIVQVGDMVFIYREKFNGLTNPTARENLLVHERFQRNFLTNRGVNEKVTPAGIWDATYALTKPSVLPNAQKLRQKLAGFGFELNANNSAPAKSLSIDELAHAEESVVLPIDLGGRTISLKAARDIQSRCFDGGDHGSDSVLGHLLANNYQDALGDGMIIGNSSYANDKVYEDAFIPYDYQENNGHKFLMSEPNHTSQFLVFSSGYNFQTVSRFPWLQSETLESDRIYDDNGALNENQRLKALRFVLPLSVVNNNGLMNVENKNSHVVIPRLTLHLNEYMTCVRTEVANHTVGAHNRHDSTKNGPAQAGQ